MANTKAGVTYVLRRSPDTVWRENDDGTILVLLESSGEAFVLPQALACMWKMLDPVRWSDGMSRKDSVFSSVDLEPVENALSFLIANDLVEKISSHEQQSREGQFCIPEKTLIQTLGSDCPFDFGSSFEPVSIEFGACDCSENGLGWRRNLYCYETDNPKQSSSVIKATV